MNYLQSNYMHIDFLLKHLKFYYVTYNKGGKESRSMQLFNSWTQLLQGVPQESVLGSMLFNIYIDNDMFAMIYFLH